jgi:DNA/RNA-binding domain of Phe-tRNA-synthetase-like protein
MTVYKVEPDLFVTFPTFKRGVVVATEIDNTGTDPTTTRLLAEAASQANRALSPLEQVRLDVWNAAYFKFGTDPNKYTPSIRFLREQIGRGKPPRTISKLVDAFNIISVMWTVPCGGDDLAALEGGDLCLGFARGDETFAPLFKPFAIEHPTPGEVIYYTPSTRRVLCRRWTWRNSDFSKIRPETEAVAINIDMMMPPFTDADLELALAYLSNLIKRSCGGTVQSYVLEPKNPAIQIDFSR